MRTFLRTALVSGFLICGITGQAHATTTIGSDLSATPNFATGCSAACTYVQSTLSGRPLTAPIDGVVVRWRIKSGDGTEGLQTVRLRVVRGTDAASTGVGSSEPETFPGIAGVYAFDTRLPIAAGDRVGIDCCAGGIPQIFSDATPGAVADLWDPGLPDGESRAPSETDNVEVLMNADIEPDADGDGFGDETQDQCPSQATTQGACDFSGPSVTITKGAPKKTEKSKVKFRFESNEPGSTFECKKDKKPWKPCTSPTKMKRLDEGKHKFKVRATDPLGNTGKPARDRFRVVG